MYFGKLCISCAGSAKLGQERMETAATVVVFCYLNMATSPLSNWYNWKIRLFVISVNLGVIGLFLLLADTLISDSRLRIPGFILIVLVSFPVAQFTVIKLLPSFAGWVNRK